MASEDNALFGIVFLLFAIFIHILDAMYMFNRIDNAFLFGFLYLFMFFIASLGTFITPGIQPQQRNVLILTYMAISLWCFFAPFAKGFMSYLFLNEFSLIIDAIITALPMWVFFIFQSPFSTHNVKVIGSIYVIFWATLFFINIAGQLPTINIDALRDTPFAPALVDSYGFVWTTMESTADALVNLANRAKEVPADIQKAWERQIKVAAGDYYIGSVDQNAQKPLGVFLEKFKTDEKFFYLGEENNPVEVPIKIAGVIRGESLELENCEDYSNVPLGKAISITDMLQTNEDSSKLYGGKDDCLQQQIIILSCSVRGKKITGKVNPESLNLYDIEGSAEGIDCDIDPSNFPEITTPEFIKRMTPKTETVDVTAQFPFRTKAYLKTYFMDSERKREMRRNNIDIFTFYKLPTSKPIAIFTGGPVMIGIGIEQDLPLAVSKTDSQASTRFGITIENRWKGVIENITELKVIPPPHIELVCPNYFEQQGDAWVLTETMMKREGSIQTAKTFNCRIKVKDGEAESLLENFPLVESYFKITAKYRYKLSNGIPIKLKAGNGDRSNLDDCTSFCTDPDGCYCTQDCEKKLSETIYGKNCNGLAPKPVKAETSGTSATSSSSSSASGTGASGTAGSGSSTPVKQSDCGVRIRSCGDYTQSQCYEDLCKLNCKYEMPGILTSGGCVQDTEGTLKETNCPQIKKCSDYNSMKSNICEENPCKLKPGNCYYNYDSGSCMDCPSSASCKFYESVDSCQKDACKIGCMWDLTMYPPGCKSSLA